MTIQEIYNLAIQLGRQNDFRTNAQIERGLVQAKKHYQKLSPLEQQLFDQERLTNPYSDTRILCGDPRKVVKKILVGIDIDGPELALAQQLGDIDLVLAHHPRGVALAGLDDVMQLQVDLLAHYGVPINIAEKLLRKRIGEVARGLSAGNHNRVVDQANLMGINLMCVHTPTDNLVAKFLEQTLIKKATPYNLGEVLELLLEIPEYQAAVKLGLGPQIFVGSKDNRVGKIALTEITGGTEGAAETYQRLADAGVGTIIGMHISEKHREEAEKAHINVVIAGHMSSDSLGLNLMLDQLEKQGMAIVPCSGLTRVSRL